MNLLNPKEWFELIKATVTEWSEDRASRLGAAVAYYTIFSIAPLLIVIIAALGFFFGDEAIEGQLVGQIEGAVGRDTAELIQTLIARSSQTGTGIIATVIGIVTLLVGAGGIFGTLKESLNTIWEVRPEPKGILGTIKSQLVPFLMLLLVTLLLFASLLLSTAISVASKFVGDLLPVPPIALQTVNFVVSFLIITVLFAMMYKVLPDVEISWKDLWVGAAVTSLLFTIGKQLIGLYLGFTGTASSYGAAGSLVALLLWIYYSAQVFFFGAEFTQVWANRYGATIKPKPGAVPLGEALSDKDLRPDTEHYGKPQDEAAMSGDRGSEPGPRAQQLQERTDQAERQPTRPARERTILAPRQQEIERQRGLGVPVYAAFAAGLLLALIRGARS